MHGKQWRRYDAALRSTLSSVTASGREEVVQSVNLVSELAEARQQLRDA